MKLKQETALCLFIIVALAAIIVQQSLALHQSWKNERTLSEKLEKGRK